MPALVVLACIALFVVVYVLGVGEGRQLERQRLLPSPGKPGLHEVCLIHKGRWWTLRGELLRPSPGSREQPPEHGGFVTAELYCDEDLYSVLQDTALLEDLEREAFRELLEAEDID